jgi:hypothetical protein
MVRNSGNPHPALSLASRERVFYFGETFILMRIDKDSGAKA